MLASDSAKEKIARKREQEGGALGVVGGMRAASSYSKAKKGHREGRAAARLTAESALDRGRSTCKGPEGGWTCWRVQEHQNRMLE